MNERRIKMEKVPDYNSLNIKELSTVKNNTGAKSKRSERKLTDKQRGETMINPTCQHGERMQQIGKSTRGIPEWYCSQGCKLEMGKGKVNMVKEDRGYGFIIFESGEEVFFHVSHFEGSWPPETGDLCRLTVGLNRSTGELQGIDVKNLTENGRNETDEQHANKSGSLKREKRQNNGR